MSYAILRTKKISSSSLGGMTSHIGRTRETPNADPELTPNNKVISGVGAKEAMQGIRMRLKGVEAQTGRKVRKDAVVAIEVMQTASPAFFWIRHQNRSKRGRRQRQLAALPLWG